ncbi:sulfurtransferase [Metallosphaera tengchongensis]|uniref:Sulfurtransferase n=2 Tax=Metallosphaera tengchongensis TaxID=1532350 RepID=A0A6N0P0C4_9CREN|nr:sulfurtransferase [Metallosphaera tengchongensis]
MLISPDRLLANLKDYKIVEITYGSFGLDSYLEWHVPGAVPLSWSSFLHPLKRDFGPKERLEAKLGDAGITENDAVVLYSDLNNRYAFYAFWVMRAFGHKEVYVLNGGKSSWEFRELPKEKDKREPIPRKYEANEPNWKDRIFVWEILSKLGSDQFQLIDVRYREEFEGKVSTPPEHPNEEAQNSGHIPGAINIPWNNFFDKLTEELVPPDSLKLDLHSDKEVVVYCRTGARASLVWFYLKFLLNVEKVRLYDGSWSEWGNMVGVPIERGF